MRILATIILVMFSSTVWSTELQNIKVKVYLQDNASGGCWTNLKETREYAEEKLRMKNIQFGNFDYPEFVKNEFWFWIEVGAQRTTSGSCTGYMNANLSSTFMIGEQMYLIERHSKLGYAFIPSNNFNNLILDHVKQLISEIK